MTQEIKEFILFTHTYSPFVGKVVDYRSKYFNQFFLKKEEGIVYLTVEDLFEFWKSEGEQWIETIVKPKLNL